MAATNNGRQALNALRSTLRHLKKHSNNSPALKSRILSNFRTTGSPSPSVNTNNNVMLQNYESLLADLIERKRLQTMDAGADVQLGIKETSRRAAARAGLQLPQQYDEKLDQVG
uniref:Uncharacterized protein n=1 Tax=Proboscia inermis TaxID=420281 RepID=A0A7S0GHI0_9STRA|mmetsp:Transcript_41013/g.41670  ORF Transcript_41013/g.41670 Transcript_41013/m.41670 type:complete len:114 (+) Transcript_41013:64-405(+)|eukprot:CAMPEP_0171294614 /NCGR_PEP_ID=MMETSP0816-20121228/3120_1 /TAXON_ID=420281 /ORGANISM="Proboscia inermis, Strain CCAP1064/1" /LENGTH=113 /DNA_ID=CAMNT_0011766607 /DNA_START=26 /DNA_END=367 /DNA_ORIENTATION=+